MTKIKAYVNEAEYRRWKSVGDRMPLSWCCWTNGNIISEGSYPLIGTPEWREREQSNLDNYVHATFDIDEGRLSEKMRDRIRQHGCVQ